MSASGGVTTGSGPDFRIAIIGAGFSGLGAAIRLKQKGIEDFVVLERAGEVGGTWEVNTYPGCRCDVPSHLYSFSFAPNPDWSESYSTQPEIWQYLIDCADRFEVRPKIRLGCELERAEWDDESALWRLEAGGESFTARVLVSGVGGLVEPSMPDFPGIEDFEGALFHSARWNHDYDLTGKRVAVVGTGASAVQIVPAIAPRVASLEVFQRTAPWIMPHFNRRITQAERALHRALPFLQRLRRAGCYLAREPLAVAMTLEPRLLKGLELVGLRHLRRQVPDRELRRKLIPRYAAGCKRLLPTDEYYPALTRDNVDVVTEPIREVTPSGVITEDGREHELDALVMATGFHVQDPPGLDRIRGRNGITIQQMWAENGLRAHLGTTIAGFPNFFMLLGPNTGLGHNSIVYMIESQLNYLMNALRVMDRRELDAIEVTAEAMDAYNQGLQRRSRGTIWVAGGCSSWYIDDERRNTTIWPSFTFRFRRRTRRLDLDEYSLRPAAPAGQPPRRAEPAVAEPAEEERVPA